MASFSTLRKHQREAKTIAEAIVDGTWSLRGRKTIVCNVTPGGGKTGMAAIFAQILLEGGTVNRLLVGMPRSNLVRQILATFRANGAPVLKAEQGKLQQSSMERSHGFATTYQLVSKDAAAFAKFVAGGRTLLVLDEAQFLAMKRIEDLGAESTPKAELAWYNAIRGAFDAATVVLIMTGTICREDGEPLAFVEYKDGIPCVDIRYSRKDALREKAIIPIEFIASDAETEWAVNGHHRRSTLREAKGKDVQRTRSAFLGDSQAMDDFIRRALAHWKQWRQRNALAGDAKCIILCKSQEEAIRVTAWLETEGVRVAIAISDDGDGKSDQRIGDFANNLGAHVLVTVAMAHVGLDVPDATHLICLSRYRSKSWLEQAFARVTRFNPKFGSWDAQRAFIFVPDELEMQAFIEEIDIDQTEALAKRKEGAVFAHMSRPASLVENLGASLNGGVRYATDGAGFLSDAENAGIESVDRDYPQFAHLAPTDKLKIWHVVADRHPRPAAE